MTKNWHELCMWREGSCSQSALLTELRKMKSNRFISYFPSVSVFSFVFSAGDITFSCEVLWPQHHCFPSSTPTTRALEGSVQ